MMERPLIPDRTLRQLVSIADRSKRSSALIGRRTLTEVGRGQSNLSDPVWDPAPVKCRVDPSGLSVQERVRGGRVTPVGNAFIAIPLDATAPSPNDVVRVTTTLPNGDVSVDEFEVVGEPFATSYAVEISFPVVKIGE